MPGEHSVQRSSSLLVDLSPVAEQAAHILRYLADFPDAIDSSDIQIAGKIGLVSAEQVAIVRRTLVKAGVAETRGFIRSLKVPGNTLRPFAENLDRLSNVICIHQSGAHRAE